MAFWRRLGFDGGPHPHDPGYAILRRGAIELHFFAHPDLVPETSSAGCYLRVLDVASWYAVAADAALPRHGIPRADRLEDKPWGHREFAVVDPDGNLVRIGQILVP